MLIKFGAEPQHQREVGHSDDNDYVDFDEDYDENDDDDDNNQDNEIETTARGAEEKKEQSSARLEKPSKKAAKKKSSSPPLLLPFYEDYHMVEHSSDESRGEQIGKTAEHASTSGSENEVYTQRPRPAKSRRKRKVDTDLVEGVLKLLNAAKESSNGRKEEKKSKSQEHQSSQAPAAAATTKVTAGGSGGRYTTVKTSLPKKTVKSLESISRQLSALQAKVDELTQKAD